eukprot:3163054-Amphidinium_carterae.1
MPVSGVSQYMRSPSASQEHSVEKAEYILSPISATLQLAHVPSQQILRTHETDYSPNIDYNTNNNNYIT